MMMTVASTNLEKTLRTHPIKPGFFLHEGDVRAPTLPCSRAGVFLSFDLFAKSDSPPEDALLVGSRKETGRSALRMLRRSGEDGSKARNLR